MIATFDLTDEELAMIVARRLRPLDRHTPLRPTRREGHLTDAQADAIDRARTVYHDWTGLWPEEG